MGIVQATTPGTFLVGSLSAAFSEDKVTHNFAADATQHSLESLTWNQVQSGQIEIKYFIIWKAGSSAQGLFEIVQLDGVSVPLSATSGSNIGNDPNDNINISGSFFANVAAGNHTLTLAVSAAGTLALYSVLYSQIGIR